jgi:hypothetical protein
MSVNSSVCESHPDEPWPHEQCGAGMPCRNPTCPLSFATETDPRTGLIRPVGDPDAVWRLPSNSVDACRALWSRVFDRFVQLGQIRLQVNLEP